MAHFASVHRQVGGGGGSSWLFWGRLPSFLPSDQDFVTPIEMDSAAAVASAL